MYLINDIYGETAYNHDVNEYVSRARDSHFASRANQNNVFARI